MFSIDNVIISVLFGICFIVIAYLFRSSLSKKSGAPKSDRIFSFGIVLTIIGGALLEGLRLAQPASQRVVLMWASVALVSFLAGSGLCIVSRVVWSNEPRRPAKP